MERLWTVVRFPDGSWSYGGNPNDPDYKLCEIFRITAESGEDAKKKAQSTRSRALRKKAKDSAVSVKAKLSDGTPGDFPSQVIVMDKELAQRYPGKAFYLRVAIENGVDQIDLDGAVTPIDARRLAREKGYEPTHWMRVGDAWPRMF